MPSPRQSCSGATFPGHRYTRIHSPKASFLPKNRIKALSGFEVLFFGDQRTALERFWTMTSQLFAISHSCDCVSFYIVLYCCCSCVSPAPTHLQARCIQGAQCDNTHTHRRGDMLSPYKPVNKTEGNTAPRESARAKLLWLFGRERSSAVVVVLCCCAFFKPNCIQKMCA